MTTLSRATNYLRSTTRRARPRRVRRRRESHGWQDVQRIQHPDFPLHVGTDGSHSIYPFWGRRQVNLGFSRNAQNQVVTPVGLYQGALVLSLGGFIAAVVLNGGGLGNAYAVGGLAAATAFAERGRVRITKRVETSTSLIPTVFAAAVFGPLAAMIVAAASLVSEFPLLLSAERRASNGGSAYLRWGTYTCIRAISAGVAGLAATREQVTRHGVDLRDRRRHDRGCPGRRTARRRVLGADDAAARRACDATS